MAIFCIRAALDFAAPTIVRWVFRAKLFLAMDVSRRAKAAPRLQMPQRVFSFHLIRQPSTRAARSRLSKRRTLLWQRKK
ncbi:MAG: hypothetical protein WCF39_11475, partial [Pseudolabrys sp.]